MGQKAEIDGCSTGGDLVGCLLQADLLLVREAAPAISQQAVSQSGATIGNTSHRQTDKNRAEHNCMRLPTGCV